MKSLARALLAAALGLTACGLEPYRAFAQIVVPDVSVSGSVLPPAVLPSLPAVQPAFLPAAPLAGEALDAGAPLQALPWLHSAEAVGAARPGRAAFLLPASGAPAARSGAWLKRRAAFIRSRLKPALGPGASGEAAFAAGEAIAAFMAGGPITAGEAVTAAPDPPSRGLRSSPWARVPLSARPAWPSAGLRAREPVLRYEPPAGENAFRRFLRGSQEAHPTLSLAAALTLGGGLFLAALAGPFLLLGQLASPLGQALVASGAALNLFLGPAVRSSGKAGRLVLGMLWQAPLAVSGFLFLQMGFPLQGTLLALNSAAGFNFIRKHESAAEDQAEETLRAVELAVFFTLTGLQLSGVVMLGAQPVAATAIFAAGTALLASMGGFSELVGLFVQAAGFAPTAAVPSSAEPGPALLAWARRHLLPVSLALGAAAGASSLGLLPVGLGLSAGLVLLASGLALALRGAYQYQLHARPSEERQALAGVGLAGLGLGGLAVSLAKALLFLLAPSSASRFAAGGMVAAAVLGSAAVGAWLTVASRRHPDGPVGLVPPPMESSNLTEAFSFAHVLRHAQALWNGFLLTRRAAEAAVSGACVIAGLVLAQLASPWLGAPMALGFIISGSLLARRAAARRAMAGNARGSAALDWAALALASAGSGLALSLGLRVLGIWFEWNAPPVKALSAAAALAGLGGIVQPFKAESPRDPGKVLLQVPLPQGREFRAYLDELLPRLEAEGFVSEREPFHDGETIYLSGRLPEASHERVRALGVEVSPQTRFHLM